MYGKKTTAFLSIIAHSLGRRVGRFMLSVLLMNFLATAALSATNADMQASANNDLLIGAQSFVICTPQGLKRITLDDNGNPTQDDTAGSNHCIYCLPFYKIALTDSSPTIIFLQTVNVSYKPRYIQAIISFKNVVLDTSCPPRAPPIFS